MSNEFRIFGPPGCGKTTYLCAQVKKAVEKHGPDALLLASFTKTAAAELGGRDLPISSERIGTLHAHCYRSLGSPKIAEANIKQFNDENSIYTLTPQTKGALDEGASDITYNQEHDQYFAEYQVLRARMIPRNVWSVNILGFAKKWEEWKDECGYIDFTDMIEKVLKWNTAPPYQATIGIFDEVQDFTPLQLQLIRKWGESLDFFLLAGDDDQTLYNFTGATPDAFLKPDIDSKNKIILSQSYRVPVIPQRFAQNLIKMIKNREPKEYKPREEEGELRTLSSANWKEPRKLVDDMESYLERRKSIMVLGACGYMLHATIEELRSRGIAFHNPYRINRGDWNPLKGARGSTKSRLIDFLVPSGPEHGGVKVWSPQQLASWVDMVGASDVLNRGWKQKVIAYGASANDYNVDEYFKLMVDAFKPAALDKAIKKNPDFIIKNVTAQRRNQMEFISAVLKRGGEKDLIEKPKVCMGTIHSVKGGQADVVYVFPDLSLNGHKEYNGGEWEPVIRQFYVGVTRCKESLIICRPAGGWFVKQLII